MLNEFIAIAYKELLHVLRDPSTRVVFVIPVFQLALFGYAINLEVEHVPVGIVDLDESIESRDLRTRLDTTLALDITERYTSMAALEEALVDGDVHAGVYIPIDFGRSLRRGTPSQVLLIVDGSYSTEANATVAAATSAASRIHATVDVQTPTVAAVDLRSRFLFNPELRTVNFFVPGLVSIIMQLITVLLTAFSIVREKELGTLEQLQVTPVGRWSLILGKLAPYFVIAMIQTGLVLLAMVYLFAVPIAGSIPLLLVLSALFVVTSLLLGVVISTFSDTQTEAMQLAILTLLPSILLSGFVFPLQSIPDVIQPVTYLIPARYFIDILRALIVRGAAFDALWTQTLSLAVFTAVLLVAGATRFRKHAD